MKTILVTGGAGTIGSGLVKSLHRKNYNVICQDISEYNLYKIKREIPDVKISCGDLKDIMYVDKLFKRFAPDTVYHCAAYKHVIYRRKTLILYGPIMLCLLSILHDINSIL